jgi:hypothetical protein
VWLLTALFMAILAALAFVVLISAAYAVASAGPGFDARQVLTWAPAIDTRGRLVLAAVAAGVGLVMAWAWTRTSLAEAASLAGERIEVLSSWKATSGIAWRLLLAQLIVAAPLLLGSFASRLGVWGMPLIEGAILGGLWLPMSAGLMAYAWRTAA